jgi:hypothetical protein
LPLNPPVVDAVLPFSVFPSPPVADVVADAAAVGDVAVPVPGMVAPVFGVRVTVVVVVVVDALVVVVAPVVLPCAPAPEASPSTPPKPTANRTAVGSRKRFLSKRRSTATDLLEEEETAVEANPDDVDEVPVVAHPLEDGQLARIPGWSLHPAE